MWSFSDSKESRFLASKRTNMGSAVLEGVRPANIHEFCFQTAIRSDMECLELQGCLFADCQECHFRSRNFQIIAVTS